MLTTGKLLTKFTSLAFLPVFVLSLVLGYSGSPVLKQAGNATLLIGLVLYLPVVAVGAVMWVVGRQSAR